VVIGTPPELVDMLEVFKTAIVRSMVFKILLIE
jgi:hypothetical protein